MKHKMSLWILFITWLLSSLACGTTSNGTPPGNTAAANESATAIPATTTATTVETATEAEVAAAVSTPRPLPTPVLDPNAPTFYVATDGNDESGNGSAEAPWATITHALDSVADGSVIMVRPGLYTGRVRIRGQFANGVMVRSEYPYQAQLRADETVLTIFEAQGITIEGFDVAHLSAAAEPIVVQIQDALGAEPGGAEFTSRITLRNNILHDSYNNDILKINNGAQQISIIGNIFYNQGDSDEHIDINSVRDVVIEDNIFFNDFAASGRTVTGESSSYIVAKDSNGDEDGMVGLDGLTIRRNIFLHYEGSSGHNMVLLGEDGNSYYEVMNVLIENNLFLGDGNPIRAPFGTKGVQNVLFRHNTISGDMPAAAFVWRSNVEGENQPNDNIQLVNNIFSDPTGTMDNFATAPTGETALFVLGNNLYWNGGAPLPVNGEEMVQIGADAAALEGDPRLNPPVNLPLPVWDATLRQFGGGAGDIRAAFTQLVLAYAVPQAGSVAIDQADPAQISGEDILGQVRTGAGDVGAYEVQGNEPVLVLPTVVAPPTNADTPAENPSAPLTQPTLPLPANGGWVTYALQDGDGARLFRLALTPNAVPEDVTALIDAAAPGQTTEWLNISPNGAWYILSTDRFDPECAGWPCLVITQDFRTYEVVKSNGAAVHAEFSTISADGNLIIYKAGGGTHARDLWAIRRENSAWSVPVELTTLSPYSEHQSPALSFDNRAVIFACGDDPYSSVALCSAQTDGSQFAVRFTAEENGSAAALFSPRYAPDGSIVFEGSWQGEQLWRLPPDSQTPVLISSFVNDNSPCVLADGTMISLWLQRDGNSTGYHEMKLMSADGRQYTMLLTGQDVFDIGLGCSLP